MAIFMTRVTQSLKEAETACRKHARVGFLHFWVMPNVFPRILRTFILSRGKSLLELWVTTYIPN